MYAVLSRRTHLLVDLSHLKVVTSGVTADRLIAQPGRRTTPSTPESTVLSSASDRRRERVPEAVRDQVARLTRRANSTNFTVVRALVIALLMALVAPLIASAHPGRTAADGCHYCRTNCARWGVPATSRDAPARRSRSRRSSSLASATPGARAPDETERVSRSRHRRWRYRAGRGPGASIGAGLRRPATAPRRARSRAVGAVAWSPSARPPLFVAAEPPIM